MPTFRAKLEVNEARVRSRSNEGLGPETDWNLRCKAGGTICTASAVRLFSSGSVYIWRGVRKEEAEGAENRQVLCESYVSPM